MGELEALVDGLRTDRPRLSTTEVNVWALLIYPGILIRWGQVTATLLQ